MNISSWFRNWLNARRADQPAQPLLNHTARLSLRKLEDRQVLSVSASFLGGVLDVAIDGGTDSNPQHVDSTNHVSITVDALNQVLINGVLVDSDNGLAGVQWLDAVNVSNINVHDVAGAANTIDLSGVSFANGFTQAGGVSVSLNGGAGADTITGSGFNDLISGGLGNDALRGGGGNDVYQFQNIFGVDTVIDSSGTADSLAFSAVTSDVTVNLQTHTATVGTNSVNFAVAEIDSVVGHAGGNDSFQGLNATSNWNVGATGTDYSSPGAAINASGFETLQGGNLADTFHVVSSGSWALKGGAGADVFDIDATFSGTLDGQTDSDTLQGTNGIISGPVTVSAGDLLSPGDSPGILSTGNLTFANSSTFIVEMNDTNNTATPGGIAGIDYDLMQVTGTVTIGTNVTLNLQDLGSTQANARDVYTIISNDSIDAVSGTFNGLANGAVVAAIGGINYRIYYNGGDGNDVVLIGRPAALTDVFVSHSFVVTIPGSVITDVDFVTGGDQAGIYGLDGYTTIAEAITGVDAGGTVHVDTGTYLHTGTLTVNKSVTIDGQGMNVTQIRRSGAAVGNFDVAISVSANDVTLSDAQLGWQTHSTLVSNVAIDYKGYVVYTSADNTTISRVLFGNSDTGEGYRSAVVFEGTTGNGADGLEVSNSIFEGRWGRAAIRDGDSGSGENFLITHNEFREDHFRWGPIAIGPQDSAGTPNNFAFSGEIAFNYFGNGLDAVDFQSGGNQNTTVTITNQGLTATGLDIVHNTFDWNDSIETNVEGVYAQPAGVYITPSLTGNTDQILIQDNIFNNFAFTGPQPGTTDPLWRPTGGVFGGALEFDGVDDFGVWQSSLFDVGTTGTLNFWVQLQDTTSRSQFFEGPGNAGMEFQFRNTPSSSLYGRTTTVGSDFVIRSGPDGATLLNSWHNVQYTWDFNATNTAGKMRVYLDGAESTYVAGSTPNDLTWGAVVSTVNGLMNVGRDPGDATRYFDGLMDDVAWFNSVLSVTDRTTIQTTGAAALAADTRLVAHWDFDQSSGNIAIDNKSGIQMYLSTNGIVPLGPTYQASGGHFGGALDFDGLDDLATFQDPDFDVGAKGTLSFWVNFDNTGVANQFFEGPGNAGFEMQYRNNSGGQIYGRTTTAGGDFVIRSGGDAALLNSGDGWHNVQYTWDHSTGQMRVYLDGTESAYLAANNQNLTWASVVDTANGLMHMGYDPGSAGQFLDGQMDDVAWYNDVLTSTELATVRISGASAHTDLVANWKFDSAPTVDNSYTGDSGTDIVLYLQQLPPEPPVSGYGVVTPAAAVVLNNVFYNEVAGTYADSNQTLDPSNITGPTANPFFNGDQPGYSGATLEDFYTLRFGSSAAYQSTEFEASIATSIPHVGANQENPVEFGTEDILVVGSDFDDLVVVTFTSDNDGYFSYTRDVTGLMPDYVGTFHFVDITSFTFDARGGDDVFIINQPVGGLYGLVNGIVFHGGADTQNGNALDSDGASGGDTLVLLTSDLSALNSAHYLFGDATLDGHSGTITLSDALHSTIITYTGTEPIRDELSVNERTFTFASTDGGGHETITVSAPGDTVAMTSTLFLGDEIKPEVTSRTLHNLITSTLGPSVSFNNPHSLMTINAGDGDDTVQINSTDFNYHAALTINGDAGTDAVHFNANLSLGSAVATGSLDATAESIDMAAGVLLDTTGGDIDGHVTFTAVTGITMNDTATIAVGTGDVTMFADGGIAISQITSANLVTLTSTSGAITDNRSDEAANVVATTLLVSASTGIGVSDDIDTTLSNLEAVTGTGGVVISNQGDLAVGGVSGTLSGLDVTGGSGDIDINTSGSMTVTEGVSGPGNITLTATGIASDLTLQSDSGVSSTGGHILLSADRTITISEDITVAGSHNITATGNGNIGARNILVNSGAVVSTVDGALLLDADQGMQVSGVFSGIVVEGALTTVAVTGTGVLTLTGRGGNGLIGLEGTGAAEQHGVFVSNGGTIRGGTSGSFTINGIGGASSGDSNHGVRVADAGSTINSGGSDVTITGQGGGLDDAAENYGVAVVDGAQVTASGTGIVIVGGTGGNTTGNYNYGVLVAGTDASITSSTGAVDVTGQGGGDGISTSNYGVTVADGAQISAGLMGPVTVHGTGGATDGNSNIGVYVGGPNATITSSGGSVDVIGNGGGIGASSVNYGVLVVNNGTITSGGTGSVTVAGTGGSTTGSDNTGVWIGIADALITSAGGNVSVTGQAGGNGATSGSNSGVHIRDGGQISAGGDGTVFVEGTGALLAEGLQNFGVWVDGTTALITSSGGNVEVTGQGGGTGASIQNYGVYLLFGGQITAGVDGSVSVDGTGGASSGSENLGVLLHTEGTKITSNGGNVLVTGHGGGVGAASAENYGVAVSSGSQITAGASGAVTVEGFGSTNAKGNNNFGVMVTVANAQITSSGGAVEVTGHGGGSGASQNNIGVYVYDDGLISSGGEGTVTVTGTGGAGSGRTNYGVWVQDATITSHANNVTIIGQGGGFGNSAENIGVVVVDGAQITAGGAGDVTVDGTGGNTTGDYNYGVLVATTNSAITSSGGAVTVAGQGGGTGVSKSNYGVTVVDGGQVSAGSTGSVTVHGTGGATDGNSNSGVYVGGVDATITSSGGNVQVTGLGGGTGATSEQNIGTYIVNGGQVSAGGTGTVMVTGTGGAAGGSDNYGVAVAGAGSLITSGGEHVSVSGAGGGTGGSDFNVGVVVLSGAEITSGLSAMVTVDGTGGATSGTGNHGVFLNSGGATITSGGGDVLVTGQAGGTGAAADNYGVYLFGVSQLTAGGGGTVTVEGTGSPATGAHNIGVRVAGTGAAITSHDGAITVTGIEGAGPSGMGIVIETAAEITHTNNGFITLIGNSMEFDGSTAIHAGAGTVAIHQLTDGVEIDLGAVTNPMGGPLSLSDIEMNRITAGLLLIGNANSDTITVSQSISLTTVTTLQLETGTDIHVAAPLTTIGNVNLIAATEILVSSTLHADLEVNMTSGGTTAMTTTASISSVTGDITMTAGAAPVDSEGEIFMADGAVIDGGSGLVTMTADDDITLGQVITTNNTMDAIRITSNYAALIDGGDAGSANIVAESATARVTLHAVTGIGSVMGGGTDAALETSVAHLDAVNASSPEVGVSGDVRIDEVDVNGLSVRQIDQQGAGDVVITSQGTIVVTPSTEGGSGVHSRDGSILVSAENNSSDLDIRHAIDTTGGGITLLADNDVLIGEPGNGGAGLVRSQGGDIAVRADDDAIADDGFGGELWMQDGAVMDAAAGTIEMRADENITLASLQTINATGTAVTLTTRSGGIVDGGDTDRNIVADADGAVVTISSITGIGSGDALETMIAALDATNSTSGHVLLNEWNAITLAKISQSGGGRVDVHTMDGTITVDNQGFETNAISVGGAGTLLLDARGTTSDVVVRDGILTVDGLISLLADHDITFEADGDITTTSGDVTVTADQDDGGTSSGAVVMADGAILNASIGTIQVTADGSITLGSLQTTNTTMNAVRLTSREGGVIDGGDMDRDIIADAVGSQVTILSATGVGSANPLETEIAGLSVLNSTSGNVQVDEQNALMIQGISQQGGGAVVVTTQGMLTIAASGTGITSLGGLVTLTAKGVSSDVLVDAPITVIGGSGDITLSGDRDVIVHDTGVANDLWVAGTGTIRLNATQGEIVLGSQNPAMISDLTQHMLANDVVLQTGTGAVTNTLPLVFNIQSPQVNALGEVFLSMDIGRPGEKNITVTVFWGDGTFTKTTFADPGNYTFTHRYFGNPNALDPSAPLLINVQVAHDPHVVLTAQNVNTPVGSVPDIGVLTPPPVPAQNINADLSAAIYVNDARPAQAGPFRGADSKVFSAPGDADNPGLVVFQDTTVKATAIPVPGTGLASFPFDVTPPVAMLAIPEATRFLDILQVSGSQISDSNSSRTELARSDDSQLAERLVTLEVLSPDDSVRQRVVLPETVLEDMLEVIGRLPDGKYRFQLQEPGEERQRLLLEFEVRQGKIAGATEESDRPPSATKKKSGMTESSSEVIPEGGSAEDAAVPDQSIMRVQPRRGILGEGLDREPGESTMPAKQTDGDSPPNWGTWSSIATRRAWKRAESVEASPAEDEEWSAEDTLTETTTSTPNGDGHTLAGSAVMLVGALGLWAGGTATFPDERRRVPQPTASLSCAAQLFRKYTRTPK